MKKNPMSSPTFKEIARRGIRTRRLGVITHPKPDMKAHYFVETLRGIDHALAGKPYVPVINPSAYDVSGLLLLAPSEQDPAFRAAVERRIPTVILHGASTYFSSVDVDNIAAAFDIVSHLLTLGHTRVAIINGRLENSNGQDRLEGYRRALRAHRCRFDDTLVVNGDFSETRGYAAAKKLILAAKRPTAIFAANDHMAIGAMKALRGAGLRVPRDVALVGFDDIQAASSTNPPLTTVQQPLFQMAYEAARYLTDAITEQDSFQPRRILVQGKLVIRQSCGASSRS